MNTAQPASGKELIRALITIALLASVGALVLWLPAKFSEKSAVGIQLTPPACDLNSGPCRLQQGRIELVFSLGPTPLQSLKTLQAQLQIEGIEPERVLLSLEGRDMYMGLNRTELARNDAKSWTGTTELAVCTTGRMVWRAHLLIQTNGEQYTTWFDFEAR